MRYLTRNSHRNVPCGMTNPEQSPERSVWGDKTEAVAGTLENPGVTGIP